MSDALKHVLEYPLLSSIFGRRARRFGLGMEIPSGPLAFTSRQEPMPLSELERSLLLAVGTGVSGWHFGVPFGPDRPDRHAHYSVRFTGRTAPTAGGFGTPAMLFTDDDGLYLTNTRDIAPERMREFGETQDDAERIEEFVACMAEVAQYVLDTYGKFPGAFTTMVLPGFVQAVHLDTEFYDEHYRDGAYPETHAEHMRRWHA